MATPTPKELKKIAKACREAGIKVFKGEGFELTFSDEALVKPTRRNAKHPEAPVTQADAKFESDSLAEHELLFWSSDPGGQSFLKEESENT